MNHLEQVVLARMVKSILSATSTTETLLLFFFLNPPVLYVLKLHNALYFTDSWIFCSTALREYWQKCDTKVINN